MSGPNGTPHRAGIVFRFVLVISVSLILTFGLFVLAAYYTGIEILNDFDRYRTLEIASIIQNEIATTMREGDPAHIESILNSAERTPSVTSVALIRPDSSIIRMSEGSRHSDIPYDLLQAMQGESTTRSRSLEEHDARFLSVLIPLEQTGECGGCHDADAGPIGYLAVKSVTSSFADITRNHRDSNIITAVLVFVVIGLVVSVSVLLIVVRPLRRFTRDLDERSAMVKLGAAQDGLALIEPGSGDSEEIVRMVDRFNDLSGHLNNARREVQESHRKELETAWQLSRIGEMAAYTAHEIKNPLAGIRGSLQTISSRLQEGSGHKEILSRVISELERIYSSILDLLTRTQGRGPSFEVLNVNELVTDIVEIAGREAAQQQVALSSHLDPSLPPIEADREILKQIVWNLIANAIHAAQAGGFVTVTTGRAKDNGNAVALVVQDDGPGIDESLQKEVFKPFVSGKEQGAGLGLPVVKRGVEAHGGRVDLQSTPGKGSVFTVTIPVVPMRAHADGGRQ